MFDPNIWYPFWVVIQDIIVVVLFFTIAGVIVWKTYDHFIKLKAVKDAIKVCIWARKSRKSIQELTVKELDLNMRLFLYDNPKDWKIIKNNMDKIYKLCEEKLEGNKNEQKFYGK